MSELTERERWRCFASARIAQSVEHQTFNLRVQGSSPCSGAFTGGGCSCCNLRLVGFCAYTSTAAEGRFAPLASLRLLIPLHSTAHHRILLSLPLSLTNTHAHTHAQTHISSHPSYSELLHLLLPCIIIFVTISITTIHLHLPLSRISTNSNFRRWSLDGIIDDASQQHARILSLFSTLSSCPSTPSTSFLPSFLPSSTSVPSRPRSRSHSHFPPPFILSLYDELSGCLTVLGQSAEWRSGSVLGP
ncbi:hypothetical protein Aperf_G00000129979 [Anoplocephala perfoliata]